MKKTYYLQYGTYTLIQVHVILKTLVYENKLSNILKMYFFTEAFVTQGRLQLPTLSLGN